MTEILSLCLGCVVMDVVCECSTVYCHKYLVHTKGWSSSVLTMSLIVTFQCQCQCQCQCRLSFTFSLSLFSLQMDLELRMELDEIDRE